MGVPTYSVEGVFGILWLSTESIYPLKGSHMPLEKQLQFMKNFYEYNRMYVLCKWSYEESLEKDQEYSNNFIVYREGYNMGIVSLTKTYEASSS